jgi:hypothetical protein
VGIQTHGSISSKHRGLPRSCLRGTIADYLTWFRWPGRWEWVDPPP